ncbi:hypothetical protein [Mesorhizobium sp.]|uniref:hypothetical protein n=1 Tax=Mesorhizobium sp. TaxID=1871066 RepID=UPI000FE50504|nr:hypothetical protein [Mesorhizobium sp.]RWA97849.1 MAG: hypothetical protein EOQ33_29870 [Mesorhizobium sp.]
MSEGVGLLGEPADWLAPFLSEVVKAPVLVALVGAMAAAYFGAWGAQRMISRDQQRQAVVAELNAISAALSLCFNISNVFISLKGQFVRPMHGRFLDGEAALRQFQAQTARSRSPFKWQADFRTVPLVFAPTEFLQTTVLEKIGMRGLGVDALIRLKASEIGLAQTINQRTEAIALVGAETSETLKVRRYFGVSLPNGDVDERFADALRGIVQQTDDCIYFSYYLARELTKYGDALRLKYKDRWGWRLPKLQQLDWKDAHEKKLIPPDEEYKAWSRAFVKIPSRWEKARLKLSAWRKR